MKFTRHHRHWPPGVPKSLAVPRTTLVFNLETSAARYPDKTALEFYGGELAYRQVLAEVQALAAHLQAAGVRRGDRVLLDFQNSPQFAIGCYAILRADACVVPANPMLKTDELRHLAVDAGARVMLAGQELWPELAPLVAEGLLRHVVLGAYADYIDPATDLPVPAFVRAPRAPRPHDRVALWAEAVGAGRVPRAAEAGPDDLAIMPYTSGTTGQPKGCMHSHATVLATSSAQNVWRPGHSGVVALGVLPMFHVTGMQSGLNSIFQCGGSTVLLARWDRRCALAQIERRRVTAFTGITTMLVDLLAEPEPGRHDLSSLVWLGGGGAAMPEAVADRLKAGLGLDFVEGYGLSETMAPTHVNPVHRPKKQCAGIPIFDVDARVRDPDSGRECGVGEVGEIIVRGPQVFLGYWNQPQATKEAFVEHDGERFFRTGDLGRHDEDGYFFITDRLKRMINCAGFKVWPAEVEAMLYAHPDVQEACVIAGRDPYRGETVKAVIVPKPGREGISAQAIEAWARERMAAYKVPRMIEFAAALPRTGTGKILWRALQEAENARVPGGDG